MDYSIVGQNPCGFDFLKATSFYMSNLRRYFGENDTVFLTNVTFNRQPILIPNIHLYHEAVSKLKAESKIELIAWVVLPDHFHWLIRASGENVSSIIKRFKLSFSTLYRGIHGQGIGRMWQYRFWDHIIRNDLDFQKHFDYIHFNPVKHGLATAPTAWEYSSYREYVDKEYYDEDWEIKEKSGLEGQFGE